jgi:hypothetical protein
MDVNHQMKFWGMQLPIKTCSMADPATSNAATSATGSEAQAASGSTAGKEFYSEPRTTTRRICINLCKVSS